MKSVQTKYAISAILALAVVISVPIIGFTVSEVDDTQGMVLDFGYWEIDWIEMTFTDGMDGHDALEAACHIKGYEIVTLEDGTVFSINGQVSLVGVTWGFYVFDGTKWQPANPYGTIVSDYNLVSWARASGADSVIPATDSTGHTYYGYAQDGVSKKTGQKLKVVSLAPSITEMVCSVGGFGYIVGTDLYSNYPHEVKEAHESGAIAITGGYTDPNYEWIVRLSPDIVFCDAGTGEHVALADKLRKSGIDCVVLYDGKDVGTVCNDIWIVASALGSSENAHSVIGNLRTTMDTVAGIAGVTNTRVFVSLSVDPSPWTAGSGTYMNDIITIVGGKNIFAAQSTSWFMVSKEQIYAKQPDVIIIISGSPVDTWDEYDAVVDSMDPVWKETPAYRNGKVYVFSEAAGDILSRAGPRLGEASELVAKILNPDAFTARDALDVIPYFIGDDYKDYLKYQVVQ